MRAARALGLSMPTAKGFEFFGVEYSEKFFLMMRDLPEGSLVRVRGGKKDRTFEVISVPRTPDGKKFTKHNGVRWRK